MNKLKEIYNLIYNELCRQKIEKDSTVHRDIEKILKLQDRQTIEHEGLRDFIAEIEKRIEKELDDDFINEVSGATEESIKSIFFKENKIPLNQDAIDNLINKRKVEGFKRTDDIIDDPYEEVVITSNILLTLPKKLENLDFQGTNLIDMDEQQVNWYDHPIPLDINDDSNEIIYGLVNLNKALKKETDEKINVILSVSVTHNSLNKIAKQYIESKLSKYNLDNLKIYIFTETECNEISDIIAKDNEKLKKAFGVSGKYGRHYTFLKAIVPLFRDVIDNKVKATFKMDLDQVFPQEDLYRETGKYAFENFKSFRWGGTGIDGNGNTIRLGMMAGGLVNDSDIDKGLFTPDMKKPKDELNIEQVIFNSSRPQYISTVAEICKAYKDDEDCIIRYHVTGGMNGILLKYLEKYRPFTPSFVTRAEDQAYILSVFNKEIDGEYLRCVHKDKFVMRHDKGTFLSEDLKNFEIPKSVGDFERMLIFTHYVHDILDCSETIKNEINPFTGSFVLDRPYLILLLRMITRVLILDEKQAMEFLDSFIPRINNLIKNIDNGKLKQIYEEEKEAYDVYYDAISKGFDEEASNKLKNVFERAYVDINI